MKHNIRHPKHIELFKKLTDKGKYVFTPRETVALLGISYQNALAFLNRLVIQGLIFRIRGKKAGAKYSVKPISPSDQNHFWGNWYLLAREYISPQPYYISHYSAMSLHNMTAQPINTVFVSTAARPGDKKTGDVKMKLIYCQEKNIHWGIISYWLNKQEKIQLSDLQRTLLDILERPDLAGGITEIVRGIWLVKGKINWDQMMIYLQKKKKGAVYKRLGYITELLKLSPPENAQKHLSKMAPSFKGYVRLDPTLDSEGPFVKKWGLRINVNPQELIRATHS